MFDGVSRDRLQGMGEVRTPGVADLFVAKIKGAAA
jgi:ABC-2 type transport system ATP-binding protein